MKRSVVTLVVLLYLSGCTSLPRGEVTTKPMPVSAITNPISSEVVGMEDADRIETINDEEMFISTPLFSGDSLPERRVPYFSISNATVYDLLQTLFAGTGVSYTIESEHPGASIFRRAVSAQNIAGTLPRVLDMFSHSMGFYYHYVDGVLHITPDRQYIAKIPPANEIFDSLPPMLKTLGATDVFLDKTTRAVTYRATKPVQEKASSYLKWLRDNKKLIVYETYIAEVVLDDSTNTGIQWNKLSWFGTAGKTPVNLNITGGNTGVATAGTLGVGAVFTGGHFAVDVLANFLKTQGTVNQLSRIPMMLIAGGETSFRNGGTDYYVSSIGAQSIAANGQIIQGQSQLSPLNTGIDVKIKGDIYDGAVFTKVDMLMNTLIGYKSFPAGQGQTLQAPITTDRAVNTTVRVRSGDTILLAGINYEKYKSAITGLPGGKDSVALATSNEKAVQHSELVIVMRPKIIQFARLPAVSQPLPVVAISSGNKGILPPVITPIAPEPDTIKGKK